MYGRGEGDNGVSQGETNVHGVVGGLVVRSEKGRRMV